MGSHFGKLPLYLRPLPLDLVVRKGNWREREVGASGAVWGFYGERLRGSLLQYRSSSSELNPRCGMKPLSNCWTRVLLSQMPILLTLEPESCLVLGHGVWGVTIAGRCLNNSLTSS